LIIVLVAALGVLLPTLGCSLLFVLAIEQLIRRFTPRAALWLGLRPRIRQPQSEKPAK